MSAEKKVTEKKSTEKKVKKEVSSVQLKTEKKVIETNLVDKYKKDIIPALMKKFDYKNIMEAPKLLKIVVNRGIGEATQDIKVLEKTLDEIFIITQQKPIIRRAKNSIANFKLRKGQPIGVMVTLRGKIMYAFLDKLISTALPRIRDFKGLDSKSFDGRGSFTFGIKEQLIFPEIDYNKVDKIRGMNISIITNAQNDESARALLEAFGVPFRN